MINAINVGFFNALKLWPTTWTADTAKAVGDIVKATTYNSHTYLCTTAGTTHASIEPTWGTTNGGTTSDGTVTWTCYDWKTYNILAPQTATVPYVTFGQETNVPIGTFESLGAVESLTFWVNVFSKTSTAHVTSLGDLILTALDNTTLTVSGYSHMVCRREFIGSIIYDVESLIYQIPLRYRVMISL